MLASVSARRGVRAAAQWWRQAGAARAGFASKDVPDGHDAESLTGDKCNISMKRRVDITLRQDLKLAEARSWDAGVEGGFAASALGDLFKGKTVVLFGVPGAYTGVCSQAHVPGYASSIAEFKKRGVDFVGCVAPNDPYTMQNWAEKMGVDSSKVTFFGDHDGSWTRALGMEVDLSVALLGVRSHRYSMLIKDGIIIKTNVEEAPSDLKVTDAQTMLKLLDDMP